MKREGQEKGTVHEKRGTPRGRGQFMKREGHQEGGDSS